MAGAATALGLENIDFYILNESISRSEGNIHYVKIRNAFFPYLHYRMLLHRYDLILEHINLDKYDRVILRYPFGDESGLHFMEGRKIITEHHTDELAETAAKYQIASNPLQKALRKEIHSLESLYGGKILNKADKIVGMTDEIVSMEIRRSAFSGKSRTIANGIDVSRIKHTGFKPFDGKSLTFAFVASHWNTLWHGGDRLLKSLGAYRGPVKFKLKIAGDAGDLSKTASLSGVDIQTYGRLEGSALDEFMGDANIAVSTLGLFRKNMNQACSLKTREYTARGIPFIMAYDDPDLKGISESESFFLNFPNDESIPDADKIISFAESMALRNTQISSFMRDYALAHMDWRIKIQNYMDFVALS